MVAVGVGVDVFSAAMNTSTGNQTLTGSCGGRTPKAALIFATRGTALGTPVSGAMISIGMTDGTNHRLSSAMSENGQLAAVADTGRRVSDASIVQTLDTADETLIGEATFVSFGADAITINVATAPATAVLLVVCLFYGDLLQANVHTLAASGTKDVEVAKTGLAFRPRVIFGLGGIGGFTPAGAGASRMTFGYAVLNDDGTVQGQAGFVWYDRDRPSGSTATGSGHRSDSFLARGTCAGTTWTEEARYEVTLGTSDGYKVTTRANSNGINIGCLALYLANSRAWVGVPAIATATTGTKNITSPGWRPQALFGIGTSQNSDNAYVATAPSPNHTAIWGIVAGATRCTAYAALQQGVTSDTTSVTTSSILVRGDAGANDWTASLVGFTANGWDLSIDSASSSNRIASFLAIEEDRHTAPIRRRVQRPSRQAPARHAKTTARGARHATPTRRKSSSPRKPAAKTKAKVRLGGARHSTPTARKATAKKPQQRPTKGHARQVRGTPAKSSPKKGHGKTKAAQVRTHRHAAPIHTKAATHFGATLRELTKFRLARLQRIRRQPIEALIPETPAPVTTPTETVLKGRVASPGLARGRIVTGGL